MKFMLTFTIRPETKARDEAIARFQATGGRPPQGVALLGRWTAADFSGGFDLLEGDDLKAVTELALMWSDLMELKIVPVIEDEARSGYGWQYDLQDGTRMETCPPGQIQFVRDRKTKDKELQARFKPLADTLSKNEAKINGELIGAQGKPVDIGGYYLPDPAKTSAAMRPSATFNAALAAL